MISLNNLTPTISFYHSAAVRIHLQENELLMLKGVRYKVVSPTEVSLAEVIRQYGCH